MNKNLNNICKVLFLPQEVEISVHYGDKLIRAAMNSGIHINASCGGTGVCGKCRVKIEKGKIDGGISDKLSSDDVDNNFRLACKSNVIEDIIVKIPVESGEVLNFINFSSMFKKTARVTQVKLNYLKDGEGFFPLVEKKFLQMVEPCFSDRTTDVSRLEESLKKNFPEKKIEIKLDVIRKLSDIIRESNFCVTASFMMLSKKTNEIKIVNIQPGNTVNQNFSIAIDAGTTTIYGQLIDLNTGNVVAEHGSTNKQISYGEDVISRIIFAEKDGGLDKINGVLIETINQIIDELINISEINSDNISSIIFAGNTTMTQIFLKVNPKYIRLAPYVPTSILYPPMSVSDVSISLGKHTTLLTYPVVSSYVGGDIVAGVISSGMCFSEKMTLFMDLGTNAEIVIGNKDWMLCASCSAGPAFEGGGIEFGIRAGSGAIDDFSINSVTLEPMLTTIGDISPKGICGSGLISIVAALFEAGVINNIGKYDRDLSTSRIRHKDGIYEYVIAWSNETQIDRDIVLTEVDIDNLIRTKGAIFSGCMSLLGEVGMAFDDVEKIIIAGGFGSYIDLEKAMMIGLLPEVNDDKIIFVGNSSLIGAKMSSLSDRVREIAIDLSKKITNCELSEVASYMDNYIASLFLPHTSIDLFPKAKERLMKVKKKK